ncbi:MAG TPA: TIR domain-containing protein [Candidatus Acidoferrales bacterium]|nr:TIR domain-containing protein [Candidatus Acidoferrales bacterium]
MQALNPAVFLCYAAADRALAADIAAFLERGADVRVFLEEGEMQAGGDLAAKAREGRMADVVLVLFSRSAMPSRWPRAQWEGPLVTEPAAEGVRIGFVKCDDCVPPPVLKPRFDYDGLNLGGLRKLKRWVRDRAATWRPPEPVPGAAYEGGHQSRLEAGRLEADLEILGIAIADRPGVETITSIALAFEFAQSFGEDFDEVFRLEAGARTLAALAGDLATQLGMRLEGDLPSNLERLREFCRARRFLLLIDGALMDGVAVDGVLMDGAHEPAPGQLIFGGRCSTLMVSEAGPESNGDPLRPIQRAFHCSDSPLGWAERSALARLGRRLAREQGRMAECFELMQQWHAAAGERDDRAVLSESAREMVWILEGWGRTEEAERLEYVRATEFDQQMRLF